MSLISHTGAWYPRPLQPVAEGGDGLVYKVALDDGSSVAIKMPRPGRDDALLRELEAHERLSLERPDLVGYVAPLLDHGHADGGLFLVFPWFEHTLASWGRSRSLRERLRALVALCTTVCRLQRSVDGQRSSLVHRDIKPANVFIQEQGQELRAVLGDFGASKHIRPDLAPTFNTGRFTEGYAPVDQILPRQGITPDPAWDTFALAVTVFATLEGAPPGTIHANHAHLSPDGRALRRLAHSYETQPSLSVWEELSTLSKRDFGQLVRRSDLTTLSVSELDALQASLLGQLTGAVPQPTLLAAWMRGVLQEALLPALHPDPALRDSDARRVRGACERCLQTLERALNGEQLQLAPSDRRRWPLIAAAIGGAALIAAVQQLIPDSRTVVVEIQGLPEWSQAEATVTTRGGSQSATITQDTRWQFAGVALGEALLTVRGGVKDDETWDRCTWKVERPLDVELGFQPVEQIVEVPLDIQCPSVEFGYETTRVASGSYYIGTPDDIESRQADEVYREVTLSRGFRIGLFEVSQEMWEAITDESSTEGVDLALEGGAPKSCENYKDIDLTGPDLPASCLSWCEAAAFANVLSKIEGLEPAYLGLVNCHIRGAVRWNRLANGWRLPTEAEWEIAALAGGGVPYALPNSWGCQQGNVMDRTFARAMGAAPGYVRSPFDCDDGYAGFAPVDEGRPNTLGMYHTLGNATEWVWDAYTSEPSGGLDPAGPPGCPASPQCPPRGECSRVARGASFDDGVDTARSTNRFCAGPAQRIIHFGLRLARNVSQP